MSTYAELYDDFKDKIKWYTEKLDVTPFSFMRTFTEGVSNFQRETRYVENMVDILPDINGDFTIPDDYLYQVELRDINNKPILILDPLQFQRICDQWSTNRIETPVNYSYRISNRLVSGNSFAPFRDPDWLDNVKGGLARFATIYQRKLKWFPVHLQGDTKFTFWYIPELQVISRSASQWVNWFPHDANFEPLFYTQQLYPSLIPYEKGFVSYAVWKWLQSQGNVNYKVFENEYNVELARAKENKPIYYQEGVSVYNMAPHS